MRENLLAAFEGLKDGERELQAAGARGDAEEVQAGFAECLASIEEIQKAVMSALPPEV